MAKLKQIYDVDQLPVDDTFSPVPDGWYHAQITKSELNPTKDGTGEYIENQWTILGPTHQGRIIFDKINLVNGGPNKEVVERIGQAQLGSLMRAADIGRVDDTDQLIGVECEIKVGLGKPQPGYEQKNEIKRYRSLSGSPRPAVTGPARTPSAGPAAGGKTAPWLRK